MTTHLHWKNCQLSYPQNPLPEFEKLLENRLVRTSWDIGLLRQRVELSCWIHLFVPFFGLGTHNTLTTLCDAILKQMVHHQIHTDNHDNI